MKKTSLLLALGAVALLATATSHAAFVVTYDFTGGSPNAVVTGDLADTARITASPFTFTSTTTETSASSGAGPDGGFSSAGNAFLRGDATGSTEAAALADDDFFSFTISVNNAVVDRLDLSSFTFDFGGTATATGFTTNVYVQSSVDGFGTGNPVLFTDSQAIAANADNASLNTANAVPVGTAAFDSLTNVTFQFRFSDTATTSPQINRFDNVVVNGAVVPEPSTVAMLLGGLGLLAMLRRRA